MEPDAHYQIRLNRSTTRQCLVLVEEEGPRSPHLCRHSSLLIYIKAGEEEAGVVESAAIRRYPSRGADRSSALHASTGIDVMVKGMERITCSAPSFP